MNDIKYQVFVWCSTYNHSRYIKDALDGFCMQKTDFPFVCGIIDDASTDGEQEVLLRFLEDNFHYGSNENLRKEETSDYVRVFAQHKINRNCYFLVVLLKTNHYQSHKDRTVYLFQWRENAEYCAFCEGDDFWTDPKKLQKQYDFMESHPECSMCFHSHYDLYANGQQILIKPQKTDSYLYIEEIIRIENNIIGTNSIFCRWDLLKKEGTPLFWKNCPVGDLPLRLYFATKGLIGYIDSPMSVYRQNSVGSWTNRKTSLKSRITHKKRIIEMYKQYNLYTNKKYQLYILAEMALAYKNMARDILSTLFKSILSIAK